MDTYLGAERTVHQEQYERLKARVRDFLKNSGWDFDYEMQTELKTWLAEKYPEFALKIQTPEDYLKSLRSPSKGSSFKGGSIEDIAAAVPENDVIIFEIVNHLDVKLTDYQVFLDDGLRHVEAPSIIASKIRENFAFKKEGYSMPSGVLQYRIEGTKLSLHVFFCWSIFAVGFLENKAPVKTLLPIKDGYNKYNHTGPIDSMKCTESFPYLQNNTRTLTIRIGTIYAKLTIQSKRSDQPNQDFRLFLTTEIFKFDP